MSERELLLKEVAELPDYQVLYLLGIIRGLNSEIPNEETVESFRQMNNGQFKEYNSTSDLFADLGI